LLVSNVFGVTLYQIINNSSKEKLLESHQSDEYDSDDSNDVFSQRNEIIWDAKALMSVDRALKLWEEVFQDAQTKYSARKKEDVTELSTTISYLEILVSVYRVSQVGFVYILTDFFHSILCFYISPKIGFVYSFVPISCSCRINLFGKTSLQNFS